MGVKIFLKDSELLSRFKIQSATISGVFTVKVFDKLSPSDDAVGVVQHLTGVWKVNGERVFEAHKLLEAVKYVAEKHLTALNEFKETEELFTDR